MQGFVPAYVLRLVEKCVKTPHPDEDNVQYDTVRGITG